MSKYTVDVSDSSGLAVYADTLPIPTKNNILGGWVFQKDIATPAGKLNYYFKGHEPMATIIIKDLHNFYMVVTCETIQTSTDIPFLISYTLPIGDGLDAEVWYRTKTTYTLDTTNYKMFNATKVMLWAGPSNNAPTDFPNLNKIKLSIRSSVGPNSGDETLNYLTCHTDSGTPTNYRCTIHNLGWSIQNYSNTWKLL